MFETVVRDDCVNTMGLAHGGYLAALIDIATGQGVKRLLDDGRRLVTVTTNTDYLGPARRDDRLRLEVTVDRSTKTMVFASCRISTGDRPVARATVILLARDPTGSP